MQEAVISKNMGLSETVEAIVRNYLGSTDVSQVDNLYDLILEQVEPLLLQSVMKYSRYDQNKAATILGLSRPTCRRKLIKYFDDPLLRKSGRKK